jgi:hypothetical protein
VSGLFISYRRQDSAPYAGRLCDRLGEVFGADRVFMDVDDIEPGADFVSLIEQKVATCDALIAVIGPHWLTQEGAGMTRLNDPHDFVGLEIELALRRNILVVPVLVGSASMPPPSALPPELAEFAQRQAVELSDRDFQRGFEKLVAALETVPALREANSGFERTGPTVRRGTRRSFVSMLAAVLVFLALAGSYWVFSNRSPASPLGGRWRAAVTYPWGASHNEEFRFEPEATRLLGTASFLGYKRAIEDGRIDKDRITFRVRFDEVSGGSSSTHINRYTGKLRPGSIEFTVDDDRGNPPVRFTATKVD